jgi:hypothetical protein
MTRFQQWLVQILLPLSDNAGRRYPDELLEHVKETLVGQFGGVTAFSRAPAQGIWAPEGGSVSREDVVVLEVMVANVDADWWRTFREALERDLEQESIVVRATPIRML